jgi:pimeloyl-ACP methyl ester carboxylesterase
MQQVRTPICLIQGDRDEFFPPPIVEQMADAYPNIETHLIEGQTHALLFRAPAKVGEVMADFLARHT